MDYEFYVYFFAFCVIIIISVYGIREQERKKKKEEQTIRWTKEMVYKKSLEIIRRNIEKLAIKRSHSVFVDVYGKENTSKWFKKEIPYFIEKVVFLEVIDRGGEYTYSVLSMLPNVIDVMAKEEERKLKLYDTYSDKFNGLEFEKFCKAKFEKNGWIVEATKSSGDQGIDLIVRKKNRVIGVQCKKHSRPIGNSAVQEVFAGVKHYSLNEGIVVSNNSFTTSAIKLAETNNIKLMSYLEIDRI
jgi:restriction system protein